MKFIPYISCHGNAQESIDFYAEALGGEVLGISRYAEAPPDPSGDPLPDSYRDKVLHGAVIAKGETLYFSDVYPGTQVAQGKNVEIHIVFDSEQELKDVFNKLKAGGEVTMPLEEVFWGSLFAAITDKFGIGWSLEYELPKE